MSENVIDTINRLKEKLLSYSDEEMSERILYIFTDGSSDGRSDSNGGWGVVAITKTKKNGEIKVVKSKAGYDSSTTNSRMELKAFLKGLKLAKRYLKKKNNPKVNGIIFYCDSEYVVKGINEYLVNWLENNWRLYSKKEVKNKDLWERIIKEIENFEEEIKTPFSVRWVKAHQQNLHEDWKAIYNDMADSVANMVRKRNTK